MTSSPDKYLGMGFYVGRWEHHDGPEGNLRREAVDLTYGPTIQFALTDAPNAFVGTYAGYDEFRPTPPPEGKE